eukprot:CAMPEP_0206514386 /NCGR_PEP_ID=MMETSP0324_2-20121206/62085_1 /ASSEMBLY_ACC=CAM_ASM_000836 /TAXON_ID=2866 /ORGANISM="Crypthecodinium cohnii, Strain Seligo" /LENGTH=37 /DNA_ID= /DNA_START= /DNA_END= /DNA_ORIENTATION=
MTSFSQALSARQAGKVPQNFPSRRHRRPLRLNRGLPE